MSENGFELAHFIDRANAIVLERPRTIVVITLLLTAVLAGGMPLITTEDDETEGFTEDIPEQQAFEAINEEFGDPFVSQAGVSTQLIHVSDNVLSQRELIRSLEVVERADRRTELRVDGAMGPAPLIAQQIDPSATTPAEQRRVIERASQSEIRTAVRELSDRQEFAATLSDDFNPQSASASASITSLSHDLPEGSDSGDTQKIQIAVRSIADDVDGDIRVFGDGIINDEFGSIIFDSLGIVVPVVLVLILLFLAVAYRDPIDLLLGLLTLLMTIVWTFGFVGYAGIPFNQQMIAVPVLLLAVGVDFGIHIVNRYREERQNGYDPIPAMEIANRQLVVAFFIVTVTTVFGFGANVISDLEPIQNFGLTAAIGIVFTFILFGIFLPAAKLVTDDARDRIGFPEFGTNPIASEESAFGRALSSGATVTKAAPVLFVVLFVLVGAAGAAYGQDVDQTFDFDDFLPPEELPAYITDLPEPFAPGEYTVTRDINFLEDNFEASADDSVTMYVVGSFEEGHSLEAISRAEEDPPDSFVTVDRQADGQSIVTVIQNHAANDPEFAALVERNDRNGNGIPDRNLDRIYAELLASPSGPRAEQHITDDRRALQIEYTIESDAGQDEITEDAREFAEEFPYEATPTGQVIVFAAVSDVIFESAIQSLLLAIGMTAIFLVVVYGVLERRPALGLVNLFPILITVSLLVATMRAVGLPLNALTATILSITIGVGIAYSVHITHRFIDEYRDTNETLESLTTTLTGTGGALTGSMLTTALGTGALVLAITPVLGDFGFLMAVSVVYSYLTAIFVLPPALFVWARYDANGLRSVVDRI